MKKTCTKIILNTIMNYKLKTTYIDVCFIQELFDLRSGISPFSSNFIKTLLKAVTWGNIMLV